MNYEVYKVEEKTTSTGKKLKKLVLQGEGKQYPDKNVTMWSNHPIYSTVEEGQTIDIELDVKDGDPNPLGGFYKNKTVIDGTRGNTSPAAVRAQTDPTNAQPSLAEIKNLINLKVMAKLDRIEHLLEGEMGLDPKAIDDSFENSGPVTRDDVPFE